MSHFWAEALSAKTWLCPLISRCHESSNVLDGNSPSTWGLGEEDVVRTTVIICDENIMRARNRTLRAVTETQDHLLRQHNVTYPDYSASFIASTVLGRDYKIILAGQSPQLLCNTTDFMNAFLTFFFSIVVPAYKTPPVIVCCWLQMHQKLLSHRLWLQMNALSLLPLLPLPGQATKADK